MPARPAIISRLLLALSVAAAILIQDSPAMVHAQSQALDQPATLATMLDTLEREPDAELRVHAFYRMLHAFDRGTVHFQDAALAERFAQVIGHLMRSDTATTVAWQAAELMLRFPHPAATEALLEVAQRGGARNSSARSSALEALVVLREPRVLPLLRAELGRPGVANRGQALRLIAELGDPRGLGVLRDFRRDRALRDRLIDAMRVTQVPEDRIERLATEQAAKLQASAARAERDLGRALDAHIICSFDLDDDTYHKLARQGFAIRDEGGHELYEFLTEAYPFVTSDVAYHAFVLVVRGALGEVDSLVIAPRLVKFCTSMAGACARIAARVPAGPVRDAAWWDAAFFAVPVNLMGGRSAAVLPSAFTRAVAADLALIRSHEAPGPSAVLGGDEDFTKYAPRGRLSMAPELGGYFQAVTWLGRGNLRVGDKDALRRALVMTAAIRSDTTLARRWRELDQLLHDFYGPPDDLTFDDLARAVGELPGLDGSLLAIAGDPGKLTALSNGLASSPAPRVNTGFAASWATWPSRGDMIGLRVLGQRYSRSADLFQRLLENGVWPPSGLDVAASLMGSAHAATLMRPSGTAVGMPLGVGAPAELRRGTGGLPEGALATLGTLFQPDRRQPVFMHQPAWEEKQINTALAGWAEVLNLTAPFVKDANVYLGGSAMPNRFHGWVEPVPRFYTRLDSLTGELARRLDDLGAFAAIDSSRARALAAHPEPPGGPADSRARASADYEARQARRWAGIRVSHAAFADLSYILRRLAELSEQELRGEGQSIDDGVFLKSLRYRFKTLAFNVSNSEHAIEPMAVIADPVTEYQSARCLEVGTGRPRAIYVAVQDENLTFVCRGGVYSYHEFTHPIDQRLDDPTWRRMVDAGSAPASWMESRPALKAIRTTPPSGGR